MGRPLLFTRRHVRTDVRHVENPLPGTDQGEVVYEIGAEQRRSRA